MLERYGKTALVTGASSGIGLSFAERFAREKFDLVLVARRSEKLDDLSTRLRAEYGVRAETIVCDLGKPGSGEFVERALAEKELSVDILVNNAGFGLLGRFEEHSRERELEMVDLNCRAVVDLTHRLLPPMLERKRGAIIVVSSVVGVLPVPWFTTYSATKAFDLFFAEGLAGELKGRGVDVIAVQPGMTKTEFNARTGAHREYPVQGREASQVVESTIRALGRRASTVDGFGNLALTAAMGILPRPVRRFFLREALRRQLK